MMEGEDGDSKAEDSFQSKSVGARISVVAAGPVFNFIMAFVCALILVACTGYDRPVISGVMDGYPAQEAGMKEGDVIIALPSSGVHSNGFSLVRKIFDVEKADLTSPVEELGGRSLGEALLTPTKIYVKPMLALFKEVEVKGVSHITGGGFYENIPRSIPDGLGASIEKAAVKVLPIFNLIAKAGNVPEHDMFNTFNMGVGMSVIVAAEDAEKAVQVLKDAGEEPYIIGKIVRSDDKVTIW